MRTKRLTAMVLALVLSLSVLAGPALSASASAAPQTAVTDQTNGVVSIRIKADGELVYGSPLQLRVETTPEDTQYIGVVVGTKGEAKGFVTLALSEKFRILLKMIPLPRVMSATPDQEEEFNVYDYLKQLIDGNDVSVLLRVADEVASVMDVLKFDAPTPNYISMGMKLSLNLIRRFLPEDMHTRIYLDEQPVDAGSYVAGAVALESGGYEYRRYCDVDYSPKSTGVRMYWNPEVPETLTESRRSSDEQLCCDRGGWPGGAGGQGELYLPQKRQWIFGAADGCGEQCDPHRAGHLYPDRLYRRQL